MRQHPRHVRSAHRCEPASLGHAPHPRAQLGNPVLLALIALALALGACKGQSHISEEQAERGLGLPDSSSDGTRIKLDARCPANQTVSSAEPNTPEFVLLELLTAANSSGDEAANFQRFATHFPPETEVKWIRDQYWSRAKKFVSKYLVPDSEGVTFRICERRENKQNGELKLFIQSFDPQKSNPPITVKKDDAGVWKVVFYTP